MGNDVWNTLGAEFLTLNLAELVLGFFSGNSVHGITSLGIERKTEVFVCLIDGDDILETSWEVGVSSDLSVDLDEALLADLDDFTSCKSVLQSVSEENNEWKALAELVWTGGGSWGPGSTEFVKHPVLGCRKALQMLLWTSGHPLLNR